ncbi:hypothetical protein NIE88_21675 [Sporolactobacillus shoreicorticis]|uniref:Uncharacterized protein n=1 Tax=Sporolactobacillus shoreicorticis TaxID=1923877 RepID=A0ABW5S7J7_9BACL|nr:hypothetical protein [Sporolactobacillus shoreicorticis]MCO7128338.1 hypothetical protein [Sporolactobacillus shoreicorticis]
MKKSRKYFQEHPKISYLANLIVMIIFIWLIPYYLLGNKRLSYIIGIVAAVIVVNLAGAFWYPSFVVKSKK